jgi:transcription regulator MmyB-like protein
VPCFERRRGGDLAEGGVPPAEVVEALEVVEDGELGLASGGEASAGLLGEQLALQHLDDPWLSAVVGELSVKSQDFRRLWASHDVWHKPHGQTRFRHPLVGELTLSFEIFPAPEDHELPVVVYSAEPGSPSADALRLMASWGADARQAASLGS